MALQTGQHLDEWLEFAKGLVAESRKLLASRSDWRSRFKLDRTLVTQLDLDIERRLVERILQRYPDHGVLGEEFGARARDAEWLWVLDPIDGTASFMAGMPVYGTLIALLHQGVPVLGVIDQPATDECWIGCQGRPTQLFNRDGRHQCRTRACADLAQAFVSVSSPDFFQPDEQPVLQGFRQRSGWRVYGGACRSYGLLASGRTDLALDAGLKLYDYAAMRPIVEGAGGMISDWEGRPITLDSDSRVLAAGDPARHREALELIQQLA
ncbi:inositol monophosphatase family protein [Pseudomonas sp. BN411]|uniref:inositol monophosphatase family protein n=1 Tax=Pseudomonas sp. BN411 TaxID=2567887 RepID=UPI0024556AF8|nr:inositol monophosphatase family protein [Pseudomonas sp. BN411]MDH4563182.1 inositol monophosphatase family protein [Pseudomonas sp. BN411]